ncbi:hypothetical protein LOK46_24230 [Methylobacterium sp. NMS14P]|uniref:hypothetical protein n=1 Tax=unclassified Methylobacterium TaxID=2615210 RepID=UPI00235997F0|nr:hypothetical protein [Methylobacterium sp. NMS14P]WCS24216.1 hypothetical protein LOK46_24230 [Methylobacterium sp. NMS14P]
MAYSVRVEKIGEAGSPCGKVALYEANSEIEAVTIATYEVDAHRSGRQRLATVFDPAGLLVLAYTGPARARVDQVWAGDDGG